MTISEIAQWSATILGIGYVVGASLSRLWCWPLGIIGSAIAMWLALEANYFQDAILNLYYIGMGIYGWINWQKNSQENVKKSGALDEGIAAETSQGSGIKIRTASWKFHLRFLLIGGLLSLGSGYFFQQLGNEKSYLDAITTVFALMTTWLVTIRILENWIYWIFIDILAACMYVVKGMLPFSYLFIFYTLWSVVGLIIWYLKWKNETHAHSNHRS